VSSLTIDLDGRDAATAASYFLVITEAGPDHWGRYRDRLGRQGEEVLLRARMQPAQQRKHLVADEPALRGCVRRVRAVVEAVLDSRRPCPPPDVEERPHDAISRRRLIPRVEPEETRR
jgi:hypothetical protein